MKYTIIVQWLNPGTVPTRFVDFSWQDVINYLTSIYASAMQEQVRSLVVQPTHVIEPTSSTIQHKTAEDLRAA